MAKWTKPQIAGAMVEYIFNNQPVTYWQLRARAKHKSWFTDLFFDEVIELLNRHPQLSVAVKDIEGRQTIVYNKKKKRPKLPKNIYSTSHWWRKRYAAMEKRAEKEGVLYGGCAWCPKKCNGAGCDGCIVFYDPNHDAPEIRAARKKLSDKEYFQWRHKKGLPVG